MDTGGVNLFGDPHDWHSAKALGRLVLGGLGAVGMIGSSAELVSPGTSQDGPGTPQEGPGAGKGEE
ncbi:hypothetical protein AB0D42_11360 [Streptomyces sp. NPDC048304]|uniref:hypothetical protein n=1 Tax=Streptomyces sp. NPDC048304 TaxID=3154820 RepID=UPI0033E2947C